MRNDFNVLISAFATQILADTNVKDEVKNLRISALQDIRSRLEAYRTHGYNGGLLCAIAQKKGEMIMKISSKTQMAKVVKVSCPHFDGNKFVPDAYNVLEEEMIGWSLASLKAPLNDAAFKRYMEIFGKVYPAAYERIYNYD